MKNYTEDEKKLINSLNRPIENIDKSLVNSIVDKMLYNNNYEGLLNFLNTLNDFADVPNDIVDKLLKTNNKECVAEFLDNEKFLYFLNSEEKNKLKSFLNVHEINIKLENTYDYYYKMLYKQGIRNCHNDILKINDDITEHILTRYNKSLKLKLKEVKKTSLGLFFYLLNNKEFYKDEKNSLYLNYIFQNIILVFYNVNHFIHL